MKIKVLLFCVFLFGNILAQDKEPIARVYVDVTARELTKNKVSSYIKRELRALRDIQICKPLDSTYSETPVITIRIICMEIDLEGDEMVGYSLAILISRNFIRDVYDIALKSCLGTFNDEVIWEYFAINRQPVNRQPVIPLGFWLRTTNMDGLKEICEEIVADIDNDIFEQLR